MSALKERPQQQNLEETEMSVFQRHDMQELDELAEARVASVYGGSEEIRQHACQTIGRIARGLLMDNGEIED